jgi:hypothetical protein
MSYRTFSHIVEEYRLFNVYDREVRAYDRLAAGHVRRFDEAHDLLCALDRFVGAELLKCWTRQVHHRFHGYARDRFHELVREHCPQPEFWDIPVMSRLGSAKLVQRYIRYQLAMLREFEDDLDLEDREYIRDLVVFYERAYARVHDLMRRRLHADDDD